MKRIFLGLLLFSCMIVFSPVQSFASAEGTAQVSAAVAKVNVNTATAKELQRLPEVGKVTAERIIEYRTTVQPFSVPEDLLKVKGIGKKTLERIRDRVAF